MDLNMTIASFWWLILGIGLVVVAVVAVLLLLIIASLRRVEHAAADIWTAGKQIAANTVQLWQLRSTNETAGQIASVAGDIAAGAESIDGRLARLAEALGKR